MWLSRGCTRHTILPPQLLGEPNKKNGEKILRSMLVRTEEWCSQAKRAETAKKANAGGDARRERGLHDG